MISLLLEQKYAVFILLLFALIISLTFHEYGHAAVARLFGDDTAKRQGRLTLNPVAHIDPMGLAMVIFVGFGYARPVPVNPRNFTHKSADLWVAAAGPLMNLLIAIVVWNGYALAQKSGLDISHNPGLRLFVIYLVSINLLLMLFNLIPLGPLDGRYVFAWLLPENWRPVWHEFNARYGTWLFLGLIVLSLAGLPIFGFLLSVIDSMIPWISFI